MGFFTRRNQSVAELREAVHQLTLRVKRVEDSLEAQEASYERLRGRFYNLKRQEGAEPSPHVKTKEEILRDFNAARAKGS